MDKKTYKVKEGDLVIETPYKVGEKGNWVMSYQINHYGLEIHSF